MCKPASQAAADVDVVDLLLSFDACRIDGRLNAAAHGGHGIGESRIGQHLMSPFAYLAVEIAQNNDWMAAIQQCCNPVLHNIGFLVPELDPPRMQMHIDNPDQPVFGDPQQSSACSSAEGTVRCVR